MQPITSQRAFLICLTALTLFPPLCRADDTNPKNPKPGQFTNGQNGTPNLPTAPAMIVDKNNMRGANNNNGEATRAHVIHLKKSLNDLYPAAQKAADDLGNEPPASDETIRKDYIFLRAVIEAAYTQMQEDDTQLSFIKQYLYVGAEARAGSDKPVFGPEVTYGDTRSGLELGVAGYFQSASTERAIRRDSLGVSLKYILKSLAADNLIHSEKLHQSIRDLDLGPTRSHKPTTTIEALHDIVKDDGDLNRVPIQNIKGKINRIDDALDIFPMTSRSIYKVTVDTILNLLGRKLSLFDSQNNDVVENFADGVREPAIAFVVGDQHFNGGGDVFSTGATVSRLYSFGEGTPGVTAVAAGEYFQDRFPDRARRDATRLGLAVIYQDTTLTTVSPAQLSSPWNYKIGIEYTSPVLGLHDTKAVFVRYRDPRSYAEITVTYGEDGLGKNYGDVNIGKTITF